MWGMRKKRGLRNWVLMILRRAPRNGAEIMDDMEEMTHGWWRPSPGSVYPLLEEMVSEGSLRRREDGRYVMEDTHEPAWDWPGPTSPRTPQEAVREIAGLTAYLEDLNRSKPHATAAVESELETLADRLRRLKN
jgi:hypothetical protein